MGKRIFKDDIDDGGGSFTNPPSPENEKSLRKIRKRKCSSSLLMSGNQTTTTTTTTTEVIPADSKSSIPNKIRNFEKKFRAKFFRIMKKEYQQAYDKDKTDINGWYRGIRLITGDRYEVKVLGEFMKEHFHDFPQKLVNYAESLALSDQRVDQMAKRDMKFSEWSMIISDGCDAQSIHIDVPENNIQFGLVLSPNIPGTSVLQYGGYGPYTIQQLTEEIWPDAPTSLKHCFAWIRREHILQVLTAYGPLLRSRADLEARMVQAQDLVKSKSLQPGDLICTSGGIPHAGPAYPQFRMVMFGAVSPSGNDLYNVDDQYFAHTAVLFILQIVWDHVGSDAKSFLLKKLAHIVQEYDPNLVENHRYVSESLSAFMIDIIKANGKVGKINTIIQKFVQDHELHPEIQMFQYRPPRIWNNPELESRRMFLGVFDGFKCA